MNKLILLIVLIGFLAPCNASSDVKLSSPVIDSIKFTHVEKSPFPMFNRLSPIIGKSVEDVVGNHKALPDADDKTLLRIYFEKYDIDVSRYLYEDLKTDLIKHNIVREINGDNPVYEFQVRIQEYGFAAHGFNNMTLVIRSIIKIVDIQSGEIRELSKQYVGSSNKVDSKPIEVWLANPKMVKTEFKNGISYLANELSMGLKNFDSFLIENDDEYY